MTNHQLTTLLNSIDAEKVEEILHLFTDVRVTITRPPCTGLLMITTQDSFALPFYAGEVLVTEAKVLVGDTEGYGMVIGEEPRRALARAACEAVLLQPQAGGLQDRVLTLLEAAASQKRQNDLEERALVAATKVNFDLMPGA